MTLMSPACLQSLLREVDVCSSSGSAGETRVSQEERDGESWEPGALAPVVYI